MTKPILLAVHDRTVTHTYTFRDGRIVRMDVGD